MRNSKSFADMIAKGRMSKRLVTYCSRENKWECLFDPKSYYLIDNKVKDNDNNIDLDISISSDLKLDFVILYTFDVPSDQTWGEHEKMLMMSIMSCVREFPRNKFNWKIVIYTTNPQKLLIFLKQYPQFVSYITIEQYSPTDYNLPKEMNISKSYEPFIKGIGHARIFVVDQVIKKYQCSVVYMDNDTGIKLNSGDKCVKMIKETNIIRYYINETWTNFSYLYGMVGLGEQLNNLHNKYPNLINPEITPRNNGIIIYKFNPLDNTKLYAAIDYIKYIYHILNNNIHCHYNDMFAFSIACNNLNIDQSIASDIINANFESYGSTSSTYLHETPIFIHYYINKYNNCSLIRRTFYKLVNLLKQNKKLELLNDPELDNNSFLLGDIFTHRSNSLSTTYLSSAPSSSI
jgi:hypothetical protein